MLCGEQATQYARQLGESLNTILSRRIDNKSLVNVSSGETGTVGAVAIDQESRHLRRHFNRGRRF